MNDSDSQSKSPLAFVALGSNLGDSLQIIRRALERLKSLSSKPLLQSSLWETAPMDCPPGSPAFINAMAGIAPQSDETPRTLLKKLQAMETEFGRRPKKIPNEPRPLDLDLIAFGRRMITSPILVLPHPRARLRPFVLQPLSEIAPDFILPGQSQTVAQLLGGLNGMEKFKRVGL